MNGGNPDLNYSNKTIYDFKTLLKEQYKYETFKPIIVK